MCRVNMFRDALNEGSRVLLRLQCINITLENTPLTVDPLSSECRSIVAAALLEHQIKCEEVISFPSDYDPNQYPFRFPNM